MLFPLVSRSIKCKKNKQHPLLDSEDSLCLPLFWAPATNQNLETSKMPGLINKENRSALPLSVSDITSCVRGYSLAMTASMTYENIEDHAIEGECVHKRKLLICLLQSDQCERSLN